MMRQVAHRALPKPVAVVLAILLAMVAVPLLASSANAAVVSGFEIDGNLADDDVAGIDWESLQGNPDLFVQNDNGTAIGDATVFATSSKENDLVAGENTPAQWQKGSPNTAPPKTDVGNYYKYIRSADNGHVELFFAWDRLSPSGTDYYYLELNKLGNTTTGDPGTDDYYSVPNRSAGDVRFTLHELGNGELVLLAIDEWDGEKWVSQTFDPADFAGMVNDVNIDPVGFDSPAIAKNGPDEGTIPADQFFETYFDLTELIGVEAGCPPAFGTLNFRTATGESAEETGDNLKDYIEPIPLGAPSTCGEIVITKVWTGGEPPASLTVHLDCSEDALDQDIVLAGPDWAATVGDVPGGTTCQVTEPVVPTGWTLVGIVPSGQFEVQDSESVQVTVTDVRNKGSLSITKTATGAAGTFVFDVDCDGTAYDKAVTISVGAGASQTVLVAGDIPTGTTCKVTERSNALFTQTVVTPAGGTVVIDANGETVAFTNARNLGRITVVKNITGTADGASATFTFTVDCEGTAYDQTLTVAVSGGTSGSATTGLIPTGTTCTVTEASSPDWKLESVVPAGGAVSVPGTVTFTNSPVVEVLPVKEAKPPKVLPHTGAGLPLGLLTTTAVGMTAIGLLLLAGSRRRRAGGDRA